MTLNSEGLKGLFPRAKLLLSLGSTFFQGFGPLIIVTVSLFAVLYVGELNQDDHHRRHTYAVTYEDGVGDVPWQAFAKSVKWLNMLV